MKRKNEIDPENYSIILLRYKSGKCEAHTVAADMLFENTIFYKYLSEYSEVWRVDFENGRPDEDGFYSVYAADLKSAVNLQSAADDTPEKRSGESYGEIAAAINRVADEFEKLQLLIRAQRGTTDSVVRR